MASQRQRSPLVRFGPLPLTRLLNELRDSLQRASKAFMLSPVTCHLSPHPPKKLNQINLSPVTFR
jgi:hypothetical protein